MKKGLINEDIDPLLVKAIIACESSFRESVITEMPGSAIWGTVRIFSLKDKIEFWGEGRYQFEGDTFVQLGCMRCSKFNPDECKKCY